MNEEREKGSHQLRNDWIWIIFQYFEELHKWTNFSEIRLQRGGFFWHIKLFQLLCPALKSFTQIPIWNLILLIATFDWIQNYQKVKTTKRNSFNRYLTVKLTYTNSPANLTTINIPRNFHFQERQMKEEMKKWEKLKHKTHNKTNARHSLGA